MAAAMNKVYLQIVGSASIDTTPSFLLFTDSQRYLFNCGEGTQRLFNEYKLRIHKLNSIFFTRLSWECTGGLPGMAMTLRDNGKANLGLYGPKHIKDFIHATRYFMYQEKLDLNCNEFTHNGEKYSDSNLSIDPVILSGESTAFCTKDEDTVEENPTKKARIESCGMKWVVCYICSLSALPGKFLVQKAKELGVPKGPLFGKLKLGEDIVLDNGQKVLAKDVTEPSQPGPVFFIIDCPSVDYIKSLIESKQFDSYRTTGQQPCLIIHLTSMEVFNNSNYRDWRSSFGVGTEHLVMNKDVCNRSTMFRSQARIQIRLHSIDKELFPLLYSSEKPDQDPSVLPTNTTPGRGLLKFHFRPQKLLGYDTSDIPMELDTDTIMEETIKMIKNSEDNQHLSVIHKCTSVLDHQQAEKSTNSDQIINQSPCKDNKHKPCSNKIMSTDDESVSNLADFGNNSKEFEVVFIGTGASLPSKYRNVSATLLHINDSSSILLDCGEGTLGQLFRHYGENLDCIINQIHYIFISHIHADHHLGLIRVLLYQSQLRKKNSQLSGNEIVVIGPKKINLWLQEYSALMENLEYRFISCEDITEDGHKFMDLFQEALQFVAIPVIHCSEAYGLVYKHIRDWKVVYSGDTRPCPDLIAAGKDATLVIHEATFEEELCEEAVDKKHCTTSEAIDSGIKMNAGFVMLNHFSQRYPKIPVINAQFTQHTGIAFDHMRVHPRDFPRIPSLVGPLNVIFADEIEEMTKKTNEKNKVSKAAQSSNKTDDTS